MSDITAIITGLGVVVASGGYILFNFRSINSRSDKQDEKIEEYHKLINNIDKKTFDPKKCELERQNLSLKFELHVSNEFKKLKDELMPSIRAIEDKLNIKDDDKD